MGLSRNRLIVLGFSDDVWMKKTWSDEKSGYNFELSVEPKSGWTTLRQTEQGFTPYDISKMDDIKPDTTMLMSDNQIALLPFISVKEVVNFWSMITKTF